MTADEAFFSKQLIPPNAEKASFREIVQGGDGSPKSAKAYFYRRDAETPRKILVDKHETSVLSMKQSCTDGTRQKTNETLWN
jgi:hypothetical protein